MRHPFPRWMEHAACLDADPDMFFDGRQEHQAKAVCRDCPVEGDCYRYAMAERIEHGVWGGTAPAEREGRTRGAPGRPRVSVHGTYNGYRVHRYREEEPCAPCKRAQQDYDAWRRRKALHENGPRGMPENRQYG